MERLYYVVLITDSEGRHYKRSDNSKVTRINFDEVERTETVVKTICEQTYLDYQAICKEGSKINISVLVKNDISKTFTPVYSFYGQEDKFIKH